MSASGAGPELRYTNTRAQALRDDVDSFARMVNDDLYDLLKWCEGQRLALAKANAEVSALRAALVAAGVAPELVQRIVDEAE